MSLSKKIEEYIKNLLQSDSVIEIQRSDLADLFQCVPSQINYVLGTRFTPLQGYLVESRRGGGGYLRIVKLTWISETEARLQDIFRNLGDSIDQWEAEGILGRLLDEEFVTPREYHILKALISRETLQMPLPQRDELRVRLLQAALAALSRYDV